MMRWWTRKPDAHDALVQVLREQISTLQLRHDTDCQRIDRLMEALARRGGVDLFMPQPPAPVPERVHVVPNPWKDPNLVTGTFTSKETQ